MNDVPVLVCACGKRLRAPGAKPGRLGRCPSCGGTMRVPDAPAPDPIDPIAEPDDPAVPEVRAAPSPRGRRRKKGRNRIGEPPAGETAIWDGLIDAPKVPETRLRESLLYPLWGSTGVASLVILPPLLWVTSVPAIGGAVAILGDNGGIPGLLGLLMFLPTSLGLFAVGGYALLFLARVLASSALGEVHHPRWPEWELSAIAGGLGRWIWAGLVGLVVGGVPATIYWIQCGDLDLVDLIILTELAAVGAIYALMALMAAILHEDLRAANPFTVLGAIAQLGWSYAVPCLVCGGSALVAGGLLLAAFGVSDPLASAALMFLFWVVALYLAMVVLRVLGLHYHKNARALGWFRGRTRWGV